MEERKYKITSTYTESEYRWIERKAYMSRRSKGAIQASFAVAAKKNEEDEGQQG